MSILSRAFVILVTVLAVVLVALVVPWSARVQNARDTIGKLNSDLAASRSQITTLQAEQSSTNEAWQDRLERVNLVVSQREGDIATLQADMDAMQRERNDALEQQRLTASSLQGITSLAEQQTAIIATLEDELRQVTPDLVRLGREVAQLNNAVLEARSMSDQSARQVRLIQEQMAEREAALRNTIAFLNDKGFPGIEIANGTYQPEEENDGGVSTPDPAIRGQITAVDRRAADSPLAAVNVGANDRVTENMRFMVFRGDEFKGFLDILDVQNRTATGRISSPGGVARIEAGDSIYAGRLPPR